jgi:hypothetical protein
MKTHPGSNIERALAQIVGVKHDAWFKSAEQGFRIDCGRSKMGNFSNLRSTQPKRVQLWRFGQSCRFPLRHTEAQT